MKKTLAILMILSLLAGFTPVLAQQNTLRIVCTIFPIWDWTRQVLGDRLSDVELILLQKTGTDLHSFQPSAQDFVSLSTADVLIYNGGVSDAWVEAAIRQSQNPDLRTLNLMDALGNRAQPDTLVEGMQPTEHNHEHGHEEDADHDHEHEHDADADHDHDHEHEHDHDADHDHEHEHHDESAHTDEHIWLSVKNAQVLVEAIRDALCEADGEHAAAYAQNAQAYLEKLQALDAQYAQVVAGVEHPALLFGDRFPFRYLMANYGIDYYAAFSGCSAEAEASFQTIAFLASKVDELKLSNVIRLDGSDGRIAQAVVNATTTRDQQVLVLDSMQSITWHDVEQGQTYLAIMEKNLDTLKTAFQVK
ncbi:MAG: metal ABC transporter substrate-binding protein [Christensenellales bacterium]